MEDKKDHLVCPQGHYVWLKQPRELLPENAGRADKERMYFCFNCCSIENRAAGRYSLSELETAQEYLAREKAAQTVPAK